MVRRRNSTNATIPDDSAALFRVPNPVVRIPYIAEPIRVSRAGGSKTGRKTEPPAAPMPGTGFGCPGLDFDAPDWILDAQDWIFDAQDWIFAAQEWILDAQEWILDAQEH